MAFKVKVLTIMAAAMVCSTSTPHATAHASEPTVDSKVTKTAYQDRSVGPIKWGGQVGQGFAFGAGTAVGKIVVSAGHTATCDYARGKNRIANKFC
ncbi:MAG: hypothetical protein Q3972_08410 [Corynebacterium sp.]|nr:hypothetical protein [Corynebacterium sp.]